MSLLSFSTLRSRIFIFFLLLLFALEGLTVYLFYTETRQNTETRINEKLRLGYGVFENELNSRTQYLLDSASTIARDWGFRDALGQQDVPTIKSVLKNHSRRVHADVAFVTDIDGQFVAGTANGVERFERNASRVSQGKDQAFDRVIAIQGKPYQHVMAPVKVPDLVGWLGMGFSIDDALASHFHKLTELDISFVSLLNGKPTVVASSLTDKEREALQNAPLDWRYSETKVVSSTHDARGESLLLLKPIAQDGEYSLVAVLQDPIARVWADFIDWWVQLSVVLIAALIFSAMVAYWLARSITEPLRSLLNAAQNIAGGDYDTEIEVNGGRQDEIFALAEEFKQMQGTVANRESEIRYRADYDQLTGLHNRNCYQQLLETMLVEAEKNRQYVAVYVLNLSRLKEVNNTLGHNIGDQLVKQVADYLKNALGDEYVFARIGGVEFATLDVAEDCSQLFKVENALQKVFPASFEVSGISMEVSPHIGAAIYPDHGSDANSLIRLADVAMYRARERRQLFAVYDSSYDQHSVQRLSLMSELRGAIQAGELTLYYQPKLNLQDHSTPVVTHVECLVRWIHPVHGFVNPDEFIPLAEQTGAIRYLTDWVIETALKQCREWQDEGVGLTTAVNISAVDLGRDDLISLVTDKLANNGLAAKSLILEVTESAVMEDPEAAMGVLEQLNDLNVRIAIDDYGTGYSSMAQLKKLPVQELKIDRSFVMSLAESEDDDIIVRSTIELGHNMGLKIVAEGVEDKVALARLADLGCDYAQGYYIAKPQPADAFRQWLKETEYAVQKVEPAKVRQLRKRT